MSADDKTPAEPGALDKLRSEAEARAAEAAVKAAAAQASEAVSRAGTGLLDALETALFGKVGGADAALRKDSATSTLDRLRAQYGTAGDEVEEAVQKPAPKVIKEDPVAKAKAELERLKAEAAAPGVEPPPIKKTL